MNAAISTTAVAKKPKMGEYVRINKKKTVRNVCHLFSLDCVISYFASSLWVMVFLLSEPVQSILSHLSYPEKARGKTTADSRKKWNNLEEKQRILRRDKNDTEKSAKAHTHVHSQNTHFDRKKCTKPRGSEVEIVSE